MDHLDGVHESGEGLFDRLGVAGVERLKVLLECLKILNVVFSLRKLLSDLVVDSTPV